MRRRTTLRRSTRPRSPERSALWPALLALVALAACSDGAAVVGAGSSGPRVDADARDPADFGALPDFALVDQRGARVTLADLRGRPLVVAALFTTCTGPCPSIARGLARLQEELAGTDVLLVAVSVDPELDTPEVLARYAERVGADPERWIFLTGDEPAVHTLVRGGFWMAVDRADSPGDSPSDSPGADALTHAQTLLAVDRAGRRRGWYDGTDALQLERLRRRMQHLASEPAPRAAGDAAAR